MWRKIVGLLCGAAVSVSAGAVALVLHLPLRTDGSQDYYLALLRQSLAAVQVSLTIQPLPEMPNKRSETLLQQGDIEVFWYLASKARDQRFLRVSQPLTEGMIGRRILLVPAARLRRFCQVSDLAGFRRTGAVAALGRGWLDVDIWRFNGLAVNDSAAEWRDIFRLLASGERGMDYFPRGAIEILRESHAGLPLQVEPCLSFSYPADFHFYVSPRYPALQRQLQQALQLAEQSGLRHRLFVQYYGADLQQLHLSSRRDIGLRLPAQ